MLTDDTNCDEIPSSSSKTDQIQLLSEEDLQIVQIKASKAEVRIQ